MNPREREVLPLVVSGLLNKQAAVELGISEITVKLHRSNLMRKMQLTSVGELVRAWEALPRCARYRTPRFPCPARLLEAPHFSWGCTVANALTTLRKRCSQGQKSRILSGVSFRSLRRAA